MSGMHPGHFQAPAIMKETSSLLSDECLGFDNPFSHDVDNQNIHVGNVATAIEKNVVNTAESYAVIQSSSMVYTQQNCPLLFNISMPESNVPDHHNVPESAISKEELPPARRIPWMELLTALLACFTPICRGFVTGYTSPTIGRFIDDGLLTNAESAVFASLVNFGGILSCLVVGTTMDMLGRRGTLMAAAVPQLIGWVCICFAREHIALIVGRILNGFGSAVVFSAFNIYIAETAHKSRRGALCAFCEMFISLGTTLAFLIGQYVTNSTLAAVGACLSIAMFISMMPLRESPRWLIQKERLLDGLNTLVWLRGGDSKPIRDKHQLKELEQQKLCIGKQKMQMQQQRQQEQRHHHHHHHHHQSQQKHHHRHQHGRSHTIYGTSGRPQVYDWRAGGMSNNDYMSFGEVAAIQAALNQMMRERPDIDLIYGGRVKTGLHGDRRGGCDGLLDERCSEGLYESNQGFVEVPISDEVCIRPGHITDRLRMDTCSENVEGSISIMPLRLTRGGTFRMISGQVPSNLAKNIRSDQKSPEQFNVHDDIYEEFSDIKKKLEESSNQPRGLCSGGGFKQLMLVRRPLSLCLILMLLQGFGGSVAIVAFMQTIFEKAHFSQPGAATVGVGLLRVVATGMAGYFVDRAGRRSLLLIGGMIQVISLVALSASFYVQNCLQPVVNSTSEREIDPLNMTTMTEPSHSVFISVTELMTYISVASIAIFLFAYSFGWGTVPSVVISEIFPQRQRAVAGSLISLAGLLSGTFCAFTFKPLYHVIGVGGAFLVYAATSLAGVIFVASCLPETKNKALEELGDAMTSPEVAENINKTGLKGREPDLEGNWSRNRGDCAVESERTPLLRN